MELTKEQLEERRKQLRESGTIKMQGNKDYLQVAQRIALCRLDHEDWGILTDFETHVFEGESTLVARCTIMDGSSRTLATATKTVRKEARGPAGKYPMEMAETGAIGRALAACGYGTLNGDFDEGDQIADAPQNTATRPW